MKVEHEVKLNRTEMSNRWMCGVKLNERRKSEELKRILRIATTCQPVSLTIKKIRLRWFKHIETESLGLYQKDAQFRNKWRSRITKATG